MPAGPGTAARAGPRTAWSGGLLLALLCCASPASTPPGPSTRDVYRRIQQEAREQLHAWGSGGPVQPDPRPAWAARLEEFVAAHPEAPEAAEALEGAMKLRAARQDAPGFMADYLLMLRIAPDAPQLAGLFESLALMRLVEEGGYGIAEASDPAARGLARRRAAPRIAADLERALEVSRNRATRAAAHYRLGLTWHESGLSPQSALRHFRAVEEEFTESPLLPSARDYAREVEALSPGRPAPNFAATALDGRKVSLTSLKRRVVLLDFTAAWCASCGDAVPDLQRLHRRYRRAGLSIVTVGLDADRGAVARFAAERRIGWRVVASGEGMQDPVARAYSVQSLPTWYLVGRDGRIRGRLVAAEDLEPEVARLMER